MYKKKTYNPGYVQSYQKPWFSSHCGKIEYCGQFCKPGYSDIYLSFDPIRSLAKEVTDPDLKDRMLELIEEMQDAHYALESAHRDSIPLSRWD
jgi:hypothetical protein